MLRDVFARQRFKTYKHNRLNKTIMFTNDPILKLTLACYLKYQIDLHVNLFMSTLDCSITNRRGVWLVFDFYHVMLEISVFNANSVDPDQQLGLRFLLMSLLGDVRHKWVKQCICICLGLTQERHSPSYPKCSYFL